MKNLPRPLIASLAVFIASSCNFGDSGSEGPSSDHAESRLGWQFAYDDTGRIKELIDPGGRPTRIHYEHDDENRLRTVQKKLSDGSKVTFNFDRLGHPTTMTDAVGRVYYAYDGLHRLTGVHREGSPAVSYTYDTLDRLSSVSVGTQMTTSYSYDFLGRLAKIDTAAGSISYEYQSAQGITLRTLPNGIRMVWTYRPDGRLESITHVAKDNHILAEFTYTYRPDGLVRHIRERFPEGENNLDHEYDLSRRLIG